MKSNYFRSYFIIVKLIGLLILIGYEMMTVDVSIGEKCIHFFTMTCYVFMAVMLEMSESEKRKKLYLTGEGILTILGVFLFPVAAVWFLLITTLDLISAFSGKMLWYFGAYVILAVCARMQLDLFVYFGAMTFVILFYIQEKVIVSYYQNIIHENEETEGKLKTTMERSDRKYKKEIERSHLHMENDILEERERISQMLHDKLGHSINGSIYKLEAAKLLIEKRPEECHNTIQDVIDNLRVSMDEVRRAIRNERPDKKRIALLSLQSLCEECEEKYHIHTKLNIENGSERIQESIWEIILDNTFEAVTNSLKYSECRNIYIDIVPMNEVVRCTIRDDGKGAASVTEGMGIEGMKKRVREVQGFFSVETEAGMGFTINMVFQIREGA